MRRCIDCTHFKYIPSRKKATCIMGHLKGRRQRYFAMETVTGALNGSENGLPVVLYELAEKCADYDGEYFNGKKWIKVK